MVLSKKTDSSLFVLLRGKTRAAASTAAAVFPKKRKNIQKPLDKPRGR
jgi:hypothetical protein